MQHLNPSAAAVAPCLSPAGPTLARVGRRLRQLVLPGLLALAGPAAQAQTTTTYPYTGAAQTYTVPAGITALQVVATGASGGAFSNVGNYSYGARVQATITVVPGEVLTVQVGGQGTRTGGGTGSGAAPGGYNGGGSGNITSGGGASDVRRAASVGSTGDYLTTRNALLVAGGGGGSDFAAAATGGSGGTPTGGNGTPSNSAFAGGQGSGASQSGPGSGGNFAGITGSPGSNGTGGASSYGYGGGGGGGYWGGGGAAYQAGGGGGSSWVRPTGSSGISYAVASTTGNGSVAITPVATTFTFTAPGGPQTYTVPAGVTAVQVVATGASGGVYDGANVGARVQATVPVTPGEVLTVLVGGQGSSSGIAAPGGYNGGGAASFSKGGGGASDVRRAPAAGSTGDYLTTRNALLVAGGGGGNDYAPATGGNGGTPTGGNGNGANASRVGGGATQSRPGPGSNNGSPGSTSTGGGGNFGGGGGGGYYGGGGGYYGGGGGGGSSWATAPATGVSYSLAAAPGDGSVSILPLTTAYAYTGTPQTYTVPAGVTAVRVAATGAGGGMGYYGIGGSNGARAQATLLVTPGEVLTLYVGGAGSNNGPGGYNGGGNGSLDQYQGAGGGGASDVRRSALAPSTSLADRLLVAAGGGGGGGYNDGGAGGTPTGTDGQGIYGPGRGATQTAAGGAGALGQGGGASGSGGGGGGGYYGGGGGGFRDGGGGGSSWVMPTGSGGISYSVASAGGNGAITITPVPLADLVVSTAGQTVTEGLYNSITVQSGGSATLAAATYVVAGTTVQSGGVLNDGCQVLSGPGSFTLAAGGTLGICAAQGISSSGSTGAVQVTGPRSFNADALYTYNGTAAQVTGAGLPATVRTLTLANAAGLTLTNSVAATSAATLTTGVLTTGPNALTLGSTATLGETATGYATGTVQTTRLLATAGAPETFGGLGLTLTPSGATLPGSTLVVRTTGTARTGAGTSQSVKRVFDIQPTVTSGLNVALALTVRDDERNNIPAANLLLFKSENAGATWQPQRAATLATTAASGSQPTTYTASLAGISSFSIWTLGNAANPLPVELSAFTATPAGPAAVRLVWATASEKNSAAFEVERSADGELFARIGTVAAAGSSSTARAYELLDGRLPAGAARLYYRLKQVDADGTAAYSPVQTVTLGTGGLALYPNPAPSGAATLTGAAPSQAVQVLDALGRVAATATVGPDGTAALGGLAPGLYLVRVGAGSVRLTVQ
ncbi:beta strand repeat-containing protein [Hymenobacter negativus]|uniref:receptor protein-tyrosine kinase n=1 Tax=Hymenobacter negativus TaxID=2795026 RepID=A0ABS3Q8Y7_9BACT|nr:T9SS type A sorting domain-containing protein [Hymenobacter negativus]MBO2007715.1 T9SS type A sorting domain-containing protein [Hymenobacter negativus]